MAILTVAHPRTTPLRRLPPAAVDHFLELPIHKRAQRPGHRGEQ